MTSMETVFPLLGDIKDEELRGKVVECWTLAMERGGWDSLDGIPFTLLLPDAGEFTGHVNRVTAMAAAVGRERDDLDMDVLIAGALLHDVGKLLEYERVDGQVQKSGMGHIIRHPVSGAALATLVGLPDSIVSIIAAHSKEGEYVERIPEAVVVHHCDFIDFHIAKGKR
jgi:putative nucleotidyltransferase with HDIG domain